MFVLIWFFLFINVTNSVEKLLDLFKIWVLLIPRFVTFSTSGGIFTSDIGNSSWGIALLTILSIGTSILLLLLMMILLLLLLLIILFYFFIFLQKLVRVLLLQIKQIFSWEYLVHEEVIVFFIIKLIHHLLTCCFRRVFDLHLLKLIVLLKLSGQYFFIYIGSTAIFVNIIWISTTHFLNLLRLLRTVLLLLAALLLLMLIRISASFIRRTFVVFIGSRITILASFIELLSHKIGLYLLLINLIHKLLHDGILLKLIS